MYTHPLDQIYQLTRGKLHLKSSSRDPLASSFPAPPQQPLPVPPPYLSHLDPTAMSTQTKLRAAILIISQTASEDPSTDKCIPVLRDVFRDLGNDQWDVVDTAIVPDSVREIQKCVRRWADDGVEEKIGDEGVVNLIVTSGGTGFAVKDVTPEAVAPMLDREAPGLV